MSKPCVIIRTLEDSPAWLDQRLLAAYLATLYRVAWPDEKGCFLKIGDASGPFIDYLIESKIESFTIITASNPHSNILSPQENEHRNRALQEDLKRYTTLLLPSMNVSPDESWEAEYGFCALGIDAEIAMAIGRQYEQNAIVAWEKDNDVNLFWLD